MEYKNKILLTIVAIAIAVLIGGAAFFGGWSFRGKYDNVCSGTTELKPDTVRLRRIDTVFLQIPPDYDIVEEEYAKKVKVPLAVHDTVTLVDSVWVTLPFERHYTRIGEVADVWYSGYDAKIDSAVVYKHTTTQIIKQPYEVARMPRLTLDLGAVAMWHEQAVKPFAVGKLNLNRPHTTFTAFGAINPDGDWAAGVSVSYRIGLLK